MSLKSNNLALLDERLREIMSNTLPCWDNRDKIVEIQNALKSKYNSIKEAVLSKYEQQ